MAEYKVHPSQHLPAQLLQVLPYIFLVWLQCLQGYSIMLSLRWQRKGSLQEDEADFAYQVLTGCAPYTVVCRMGN